MNDIFQLKRLDPVNIKYLTRLERAVFTGDNRTVKALEKEDVNRSNSKYGFNAFLYAVELGDITIVRELMQRKKSVDLSLVDDKGRNSLMIAVIYGHKDVMMFLLKEVNVQIGIQDNNGHTALNFAVFTLNVNLVETLIQHGENFGKYIIHYAIMCNSVDIFKILLDKVDKSVLASIQEYVRDKKEFLCYLEDDLSDVVSFDTEDDDLIEKIDKSDLSDISSVKIDKSGLDVSFFTADEASITSEYLMMDHPGQRQDIETQRNLNLLKKIEYLEGQITQEKNLRQDLIQEKNDLVKKVEEIQDFMITVPTELKEVDTLSGGSYSNFAEIKDLNQELAKVSRRNAELETQILQVLNEKKDYAGLRTVLEELEAELSEVKNRNCELEFKSEQKQEQIKNLLSEKENNQVIITRLNRDFEKAKSIKNEEDLAAIINLRNLLDQSQSEKDDLQRIVANLRTEIKDLNTIKEQIQERLMNESEQTESYRNEIERLLNSNEQQIRENDDLRDELHKVNETTAAGDRRELLTIINQSSNEKEELQRTIELLQAEIKTLKITETQMQDKALHENSEAQKYKREIEKLNDQLREELQKGIDDKAANQGSKSRITELEDMLNHSESMKNELQDELDLLKVKFEDLTSSLCDMQDKENNEMMKSKELEKEMGKLLVDSQKKEIEIEKLQTELYKIFREKSDLDVSVAKYKGLEFVLNQSESEKKELRAQLSQLQERINSVNLQLSNISNEYGMWKESSRKETENHVRDLDRLKLERDRLSAEKDERNARMIEMESLLNHSKIENQKLQALSERMREDSIRAASYLNEIEKLKNSNEHNVKEIDFLRLKVAKLQKEIKESKTDKQSPKKEASEPPTCYGPISLSDSIVKSEASQVKQINNKRLEEIQRLRSDMLSSLKFMDSELLGLPTSREPGSPSKDQLPYPFLNATEKFDTINTKLLSPKVALIYERRKLE